MTSYATVRTLVDALPAMPVDLSTPSILIAEDHADSRDALQDLLEAAGYHVIVARHGGEAVEEAIAARPDLILMDLMMPQVDGFEAARSLRASPDFRQVPIIALTALEGARERTLSEGFDDFLAKPIDVASLFRKVELWTREGRRENSEE